MAPADAVRFAWRSIAAQRVRSLLTLAGIAVGIAAVILLTSIGEGVHRYVLGEFTQFGTHVIGISPGRTSARGSTPSGLPTSVRPLTLDDVRALSRVPGVVSAAPLVTGNAEAQARGRLRRTLVYGVSAESLAVFNMRVAAGAFLPGGDEARGLVVLGAKLKHELFGADNALGERVRLGGQSFRVVGVLAEKGQFLGIDLDDSAFIPALRALELFNRNGLTEIELTHDPQFASRSVAARAEALLAARHGRADFTVTTQEEMLATLANILDILTMAVAALGSISLAVGAVGIVTIMTIAVAERTPEVGLMMALGGRRGEILWLFLGEAVVLAVLGSLAGVVAGFGLAQAIRAALPELPVTTPLAYVLLAVASSALIGLVAGVLPARHAARLDPVDALRAE